MSAANPHDCAGASGVPHNLRSSHAGARIDRRTRWRSINAAISLLRLANKLSTVTTGDAPRTCAMATKTVSPIGSWRVGQGWVGVMNRARLIAGGRGDLVDDLFVRL